MITMICLGHFPLFTCQSSAITTTLLEAHALDLLNILSVELIYKSDCPKKRW